MSKSERIHLYVDSTLKEEAKNILSLKGISISEAVNMFFKEVVKCHTLPFKIDTPKINKPVNIDDLSEEELKEILIKAEKDIDEGKTESFSKVYEDLRKEFDI